MGKSKELFTKLREEELLNDPFLKEHIIFATLGSVNHITGTVTTAPNNN
jgi:hypothetical protein